MELWLFGSVAAGEKSPSDIDLALIHPDGADYRKLANSISSMHPCSRVDCFPHYEKQHESLPHSEPPLHWLLISKSDFNSEHPLAMSVKSGRRISINLP
jgi:hypothetical protein